MEAIVLYIVGMLIGSSGLAFCMAAWLWGVGGALLVARNFSIDI